MAQSLDFNKVRKQYFTIVLSDDKKTRLQVKTPTKGLLMELTTMLPDTTGGMPTEEDLATLYDFAARLMSRNRTGTIVTGEQLAEILDFEDLIIFFTAFTDFITEITNEKN